jgi:hypothetical protein
MTGDPSMPGIPTKDGQRRGVFTHVIQRTPDGRRFRLREQMAVLAGVREKPDTGQEACATAD